MEIPEGVNVEVKGSVVSVSGKLGKAERDFASHAVAIEKDGNAVNVSGDNAALCRTIESHINNMVKGVTNGYSVKMQVVYSHFPMSLEVKGKSVSIKNFLGERKPRKAVIAGDAKVEVKGQSVTVSGVDKEHVGQTVANLHKSLRITRRDGRVFQDGIYVVEE